MSRRSNSAAALPRQQRDLNHVPIIDINPRATPGLKQELAEEGVVRLRRVGIAWRNKFGLLRRTQRGRAGQWRIKGQPRRANRAVRGPWTK